MQMKTALIMLVQYQFSWKLSVHLFVGFIALRPEYHIQAWLLLLEANSLFCGLRWEQFSVRCMDFEIVTVVICSSGMSVHTVKKKKNSVWIIICIMYIIFVNFLVTVQPLVLKLCDSWQGMSLYAPPPPSLNFLKKKLSSGCSPPASRPCHEKNLGARPVVELDFLQRAR
jgi:hypothetical protein